jgi:hypothetical protein
MSATDFSNRRNYLESEGLRHGPLPPVDEAKMEQAILRAIKLKSQARRTEPPRPIPPPRSHSVVPLQREQDAEYAALLEQVQTAPLRPDVAVEQPPLPTEPDDGVLIAVALPSRKRIVRKFGNDGPAGTLCAGSRPMAK